MAALRCLSFLPCTGRSLVAGLFAAAIALPASSATIHNITASADAFTESTAPTTNFGSGPVLDARVCRATELFGCNNNPSKINRSLLSFQLPSFVAATEIISATLSGIAASTVDTGSFNRTFTIGLTGDGWSESTVNWNNAPGPGTSIGSFQLSDISSFSLPTDFSLSVAELNAEYAGDGVATISIGLLDESLLPSPGEIGATFNSIENFGSVAPFELVLEIAAIPEPGTALLFVLGFGALATASRQRP